MASLIKKLAGETVVYGISHILSKVLFFVILTPYLTNKVSPVEYSIYTELYSYVTILLTILIFRLDTALFRFGSRGDINKVLGTCLYPIFTFVLIFLILSSVFSNQIASLLGYPNSIHYIKWFTYIMCLDALASMLFAKIRLESKPFLFLVYKLANVIITIVIIVACFDILPETHPDTLDALNKSLDISRKIDYVFLANLMASGLTLLLMVREVLDINWSFDKSLLKKMLWYAAPLVIVGIAGSVNQTFSTPIQKYFLGSNLVENQANAGIYAAAAKLAILLQLFTTAFNYAAEPFFFNNSEKKDALQVYANVALVYTIVACFGTIAIVSFLDIVILLIGEEYRAGSSVVPFLLFAYIMLGIYYNVGIWYKLKDKTHIGALVSVIGMIITVAVSITLLPKIGTIASAYAALACYSVMVALCYHLGRKYYPVQYPVKKLLFYIIGAAILCYYILKLRVVATDIFYYPIVILILCLIISFVWVKDIKKLV